MGMALTVPRYTVDDLERFPNDGNRYELLDGMLIVTPAPRRAHQLVGSRLLQRIGVALRGIADVVGPGAVVRPPGTQLEPDVLVQPARFSSTLQWSDVTEHWLAVEVLSRSSRFYDREFKRIEMHLVSRARQTVRVVGRTFQFAAGESIHTENSYKYSVDQFRALARGAGWQPDHVWTDAAHDFSVHELVLPPAD